MSIKNFKAEDMPRGKGYQAPKNLDALRKADHDNASPESLLVNSAPGTVPAQGVSTPNELAPVDEFPGLDQPMDIDTQDPGKRPPVNENNIKVGEKYANENMANTPDGDNASYSSPGAKSTLGRNFQGAGAPSNNSGAPADDPDAVPEGTAREIMDWVGDDKEKAQRALDAENANDKPRKTVVGPLEEKLAAEDDDED